VVAVAMTLAVILTGLGQQVATRLSQAQGLRPGVDVPTQVTEEAAHPLGRPALAPYGTGGYAFLRTQPDGRSPVAFDPCRPVHLVFQRTGEPARAEAPLREALADIGAATGLRFVDDGTTTERPDDGRAPYQRLRYGDRWAPVLIAWSTGAPTEHGIGRLDADTLGRAGPVTFGRDGSNELRYVTGTAVFNGPQVAALLDTGREDWVRAVFLHELGHLVGLDHVEDPYQVMYPRNAVPLNSYRDGDLRGLEALGRGRCFSDY
jgi:hypothetical protein